jgi:uncharacterized membrane protein
MTDTRRTAAIAREAPARRLVSGFGVFLGCLLFAVSLTPSLVPRDALMQGLIGGALVAFGYLAAVSAIALWRWLELPEFSPRPAGIAALALGAAGILTAWLFLSRAADWQNSIRVPMGLELLDTAHPGKIAMIAVATAALLFLVGWLFRLLFRLAAGWSGRVVPARLAATIGILAALVLSVLLIQGVLVHYALRVLDAS